jgi:hypothetical protein
MAKTDEPLEPASQDGWVQDFLDANWREAMASSRTSMEALRRLVPEMSVHLTESGYVQIDSALSSIERAYASLHAAGPHVLGTEDYATYLQAQTERVIGG